MDQPIEQPIDSGKRVEVMWAPQGSEELVMLGILWSTMLWGPVGQNGNAHRQ